MMTDRRHPVDVHVGGRVKFRRGILGLSQTDLGRKLGVTFQQVQKYEKGLNRIGASRLFEVSQALDVPVAFFFEGLKGPDDEGSAASREVEAFLGSPNGVALCRAFSRIKDPDTQTRLLRLIESIADGA
ncbi:MAG: XRE family transcriptional regulator [Alphaproteobacteria bacterium]|nr:MAG: XRE family transcriptional regulator [Alphaproteobacteria bacterium]